MPGNKAFPWFIGGGAAAAALYLWHRGRDADKPSTDRDTSAGPSSHASSTSAHDTSASSSSTPQPPTSLPGHWVWPVGIWQGRRPVVSNPFNTIYPGGVLHGGVDIMYRRDPADPWKPGTPNGHKSFVMPNNRAAMAASDGVVLIAANTARGWTVVVDHSPRQLATYYTHMSELFVTAKQSVTAGTPLGVIGADPLDGNHLMHLHFEVWRSNYASHFDPQRLMEAGWEYLPDPGDLPRPLVARNGGHRPRDGSSYDIPVITHYRRAPRR